MERRWKVLIVAAVAVFMGFLDVTIVNVAFPDIERDFPGTSQADLSWVLNAYNIVFAALLVPAGRLADVLGRRRMFFVGVWIFLAASVLCGLAPSPGWLVGARVLQAVGGAILVPTSLSLLLPEFPAERRATAVSIWSATGAVAAAVGPSLGGLLVDGLDWRWVFFVNVPIGLAAIVPARRLLHETREPGGELPDLLGTVLLIAGVAALALGIVKGEEWGWGSARVLGSLALAAVLLAATLVRSARHRAPVVDLSLFRTRSFAVANAGMFSFSMAFYALLLANVLFMTGVWGYSILHAGFAVTPGPIMAALSAPIGGALSDRFGQRVVALPGRAVLRRRLHPVRDRARRRAGLLAALPRADAADRHRRRAQLRRLGQRRGGAAAARPLRHRQRRAGLPAPDRRGARDRRPGGRARRRTARRPAVRLHPGVHVDDHRRALHGRPGARAGPGALGRGGTDRGGCVMTDPVPSDSTRPSPRRPTALRPTARSRSPGRTPSSRP